MQWGWLEKRDIYISARVSTTKWEETFLIILRTWVDQPVISYQDCSDSWHFVIAEDFLWNEDELFSTPLWSIVYLTTLVHSDRRALDICININNIQRIHNIYVGHAKLSDQVVPSIVRPDIDRFSPSRNTVTLHHNFNKLSSLLNANLVKNFCFYHHRSQLRTNENSCWTFNCRNNRYFIMNPSIPSEYWNSRNLNFLHFVCNQDACLNLIEKCIFQTFFVLFFWVSYMQEELW